METTNCPQEHSHKVYYCHVSSCSLLLRKTLGPSWTILDPGSTLMTRAGSLCHNGVCRFFSMDVSGMPKLYQAPFDIKHVLGTPEQFPMPDPIVFQVWKEFLHEAISLSLGLMWSMGAHRNVLNCNRNGVKLCDAVRCCAMRCCSDG